MTDGRLREVTLPDGTHVLLGGFLELQNVAIGDSRGLRPVRLPEDGYAFLPPNGEPLKSVARQACGVRMVVETSVTELILRVRTTRCDFEDLEGVRNHFVALVDGVVVGDAEPQVDRIERVSLDGSRVDVTDIRESSEVRLPGLPGERAVVTIVFPQSMIVDILGVVAGEVAIPAVERQPLWVHHGSSISHCATPTMPTDVWPLRVAQAADLDGINLGFAGQCMLDPFVADAIAATDADVITVSVGVNLTGARSMDQRTFVPAFHGFIDRIRTQHPDTPIVVISSILWPGSEDVPGPSDVRFFDDGSMQCYSYGNAADIAKGALTLAESRRHLEYAVRVRAERGEAIAYLDGTRLYGESDVAEYPLPDGLHPDARLYQEIARRFTEFVFSDDGLVPRASL